MDLTQKSKSERPGQNTFSAKCRFDPWYRRPDRETEALQSCLNAGGNARRPLRAIYP